MKLNALKCLGFMVNQLEIENNPENINALLEMSSPTKPKEVMSLAGRVVALSHFVSRATDHCAPFLDVLKGSKKFEWMDKCEQAYLALKEHLGRSPLLLKPIKEEKLYLYLAVSDDAVSSALVKEKEKV